MSDTASVSSIPHGTANGYGNYRCRCEPCRKAQAQYQRQHMTSPCPRCGEPMWIAQGSRTCRECYYVETRGIRAHGTHAAVRRGCKCRVCLDFGAAYKRKQRARWKAAA